MLGKLSDNISASMQQIDKISEQLKSIGHAEQANTIINQSDNKNEEDEKTLNLFGLSSNNSNQNDTPKSSSTPFMGKKPE